MEAKLKSLKVADLKSIFSKADVTPPSKATKAELIKTILGSQALIDSYNTLYPTETNDDLLAPPEDVDWTADEVPTDSKADVPEPAIVPALEPATTSPSKEVDTATQPEAVAPTLEETDLEKRKARAARFGIPLVEPKTKPQQKAAVKKSNDAIQPSENVEKLKARAQRFGVNIAASEPATKEGSKRKRGTGAAAPVAEVDSEEAERRRKRAERFGLATKT